MKVAGYLKDWHDPSGIGVVAHDNVATTVYREDLAAAGIKSPRVGQRLLYEVAAHPARGVTAAISIEAL